MITQEYLKERFDYTEEGFLVWKDHPKLKTNKRFIGQKAGSLHKASGYTHIKLDNISYKAHRLIFLWHKGYLPDIIDHIDRDKLNNKIDNLRESDDTLNAWNKEFSRGDMKNIRVTKANTFQVNITRNKRLVTKTFKTLDEALEFRDTTIARLEANFD